MNGSTRAIRPLVAKPYAHRTPQACLLPEFSSVILSLSQNRRDADRVARLCQTLLCLPEAPVELRFWLALARRCQGLDEQAEAAVLDALAHEPGYACAWWLRGKLCVERGAVSEGAPFMCRAIAMDPIYAFGWLNLSRKHDLSGQIDAVLTALRSCIRRLLATQSIQVWHTNILGKILQLRTSIKPPLG